MKPSAVVLIAAFLAPGPWVEAQVGPFLEQYCIRCHGEKKAEAKLTLHVLAADPIVKRRVDTWKAVLEQIETGVMPPEDAPQPAAVLRAKAVDEIKTLLRNAGETIDDARLLAPSRGNRVDHDALFASAEGPAAGTRVRLWRLTGQAYEAFMQDLNERFKLGIRNYGQHRIKSPWNFTPQRDFSDYSSAHKIGEAEIEFHMRNAVQVAQAMLKKLAGNPSSGLLKEFHELVKSGDAATPRQVESAVASSFQAILQRPASEMELERYAGFLRGNLKPLGAEKAIEQFLIALLFKPEVSYRIELGNSGAPREMLPPAELARALAFALTDRIPDAALAKAVADGKLATREDAAVQVRRMLGDRGLAKPRILRFFREYFGHPAAAEIFKDEVTLAAVGLKKNGWHPDYFISDADRLIEWVLAADKNVLQELLTTNKTFLLTYDLAGRDKQGEGTRKYKGTDRPFQGAERTTLDIYEVMLKSRLDWTDERPFEMPVAHRMGILTHPAWLVAQSGNFDNHAIHRGRWIREKLLGGSIPDVPVTVNAMLPDEPHRTLRDRMRVTREDYCWKCHRQMDPLGLTFEQYDHFGRFRNEEMIVDVAATQDKRNLDKNGQPRRTRHTSAKLDTSGVVEGSGDAALDGPVKDPFELLRKLAASQRVQQVFVRHAFRYFIGRNETLADGPTLVAAHKAYVSNGGSMNALIASLLTSDAFLYRTR